MRDLDAQVDTHTEEAQFCNPPIAELQKKAHLYMIAVASAPPSLGVFLSLSLSL